MLSVDSSDDSWVDSKDVSATRSKVDSRVELFVDSKDEFIVDSNVDSRMSESEISPVDLHYSHSNYHCSLLLY